jgi:hypothetical protein
LPYLDAALSGRAARIDCSPSGWVLGEQTTSLFASAGVRSALERQRFPLAPLVHLSDLDPVASPCLRLVLHCRLRHEGRETLKRPCPPSASPDALSGRSAANKRQAQHGDQGNRNERLHNSLLRDSHHSERDPARAQDAPLVQSRSRHSLRIEARLPPPLAGRSGRINPQPLRAPRSTSRWAPRSDPGARLGRRSIRSRRQPHRLPGWPQSPTPVVGSALPLDPNFASLTRRQLPPGRRGSLPRSPRARAGAARP